MKHIRGCVTLDLDNYGRLKSELAICQSGKAFWKLYNNLLNHRYRGLILNAWNKYIIDQLCSCKSSDDYWRLYNEAPSGSEGEKTVIDSWDIHIINQLPNCKSGEDCEKLSKIARPDSEAMKMVKRAWIQSVNLEIQSQNN